MKIGPFLLVVVSAILTFSCSSLSEPEIQATLKDSENRLSVFKELCSTVFTTDFLFYVRKSIDTDENMVFRCTALYTVANGYDDSLYPTIQFKLSDSDKNTFFDSKRYRIGSMDEMTTNEWRTATMNPVCEYVRVCVNIPEGVTLYIKDFSNYYSDAINQGEGYGVRFVGHGSFGYPELSQDEFIANGKLGYSYVVTIPKRTLDGVWVCYHDEGNINLARNLDGTTFDTAHDISTYTYDQLMQMDFGVYKNAAFAGTKICKLDDFFSICEMMQMHPVLSCHPTPSPEKWQEIKTLANNHGLLGSLNVKVLGSASFPIQTAFEAFQYDVESYIVDISRENDLNSTIENLNALRIDTYRTRVGIELFSTTPGLLTEANVQRIRNAGNGVGTHYFCGATDAGLADMEELRKVLAWGVEEITDTVNPCNGLNW